MNPNLKLVRKSTFIEFTDSDIKGESNTLSVDVPAISTDAGFNFQINEGPSVTLSDDETKALIAILELGLRNSPNPKACCGRCDFWGWASEVTCPKCGEKR